MNIAIISLPFRYNYGHHLQAYALTKSLERLGHHITYIDQEYHRSQKWWRYPFCFIKRFYLKYITGDNKQEIFIERRLNKEHQIISTHLLAFRNQHMPNRLNVKDFHKDIRDGMFDAIVVGSDQVWRLGSFDWVFQTDISNAYLAFASKWSIKRVAYAASFGLDKWMYDSEQTQKCSELVKKFNGISVRELSAVHLCKDYLHVNAELVLDPTMLLEKKDYLKLIRYHETVPAPDKLMTYILDDNEYTKRFISSVATELKLVPFAANSRVEDEKAPLIERIQPPIEQWIRFIDDSEFVITDSFHGTVFCIIFNKPFLTLTNHDRGLSRLNSLLQLFGLEDRLINPSIKRVTQPKEINWQQVNEKRNKLKQKSLSFIDKSLNQ